jgi:transcription elongation factor GreA
MYSYTNVARRTGWVKISRTATFVAYTKGRMAKPPIQLTAKGLEKMKEELRFLKEEKRQQLSDYMGSAIADGDLRESAAYDEARLLQSQNEARIADLEEIINRAVVVEGDESETGAGLGATLVLEDANGHKEIYHLVGTHEADIFENRISDESPLGQQLVGKRAGDKVLVPARTKQIEYTVLEVKFD